MSIHNSQDRHLPVRPNLEPLKHQAKDLLRQIHAGVTSAIQEFKQHHPQGADRMSPNRPQDAGAPAGAAEVTLADAQLVLARSYQASSWPRLVQCCQLIEAIWN